MKVKALILVLTIVFMAGTAGAGPKGWCIQTGDEIDCTGDLSGLQISQYLWWGVEKHEFDDLKQKVDAILKHFDIKLKKKALECQPERYEVVPKEQTIYFRSIQPQIPQPEANVK